ncbi:hypothetical protein RND81_11G156400 [Saponaria officinalis]|uniref:CCHC-type domain-containing protein n=1 Tax=Saponaria officinalis TaxID=3572 RepID=A0AAW1HMC7_SAPOF
MGCLIRVEKAQYGPVPLCRAEFVEPDEIWLVGTTHVDRASVEHVDRVVRALRPDNVVVELCRSRHLITSNLAKLDFVALDISGNNYLPWVLDAEIHLDANGLGETIKEGNTATTQNKAKALIFPRHHLCEGLKYEYLTIKDPLTLWKYLKERYDHLKTVILPKPRFDWLHLRLQDFKSVNDYNSTMFRITAQLELCGEKVSDADKGFKRYCELVSCLLVAEQNNEILLKNHQSRPTGTDPFPEVNATKYENRNKGHARIRGRGRGRGTWNTRVNYQGGRNGKFKNSYSNQKNDRKCGPREDPRDGSRDRNIVNFCHRCGGKGHWARTCRAPPHVVDSYHRSLNDNKGKKIETNFIAEQEKVETNFADTNESQPFNYDYLDVSDFFSDPDGRIDHLIGDGSVQASD